MPRLSDETIFEGDENRSEESGCCPTVETAHCEICERNGSNAQDGGHHSHCNVWYVFVNPASTCLRLATLTIIENARGLT